MFRKNYNTILITGASSGLGRELAIQYAKPNVMLFLSGRNKDRLLETVIACENNGASVIYEVLDVNDRSAMEKWVLKCDTIRPIDLIIANAGISAGTFGGDEPKEQVYEIFNTNIFGVLNTIEPMVPRMIQRGYGQIVLISSMSAFIGMASCPAYSASKACILHYGEGLRGCLRKHNVGVSIVCPGFIKTPLTDKNNFIMPMIMEPSRASKKIIAGISKNKGLIVFPLVMYFTLKIARLLLPFSWCNYIFSKLPKK